MVGDGEISFGGGQDVTALMNALEGAAVNSAGASAEAGTNNAAAEDIQALGTPATTTTSAAAAAETTVAVQATETAVATPDTTPTEEASQQEQGNFRH